MGVVAAIVALSLLLLASCGQSNEASSAASSRGVDRSDPVAVAVAMVTALVELDLETFRSFVVPEQRSAVDDLILAAEAGAEAGNARPERVTVSAVLVERSEERATVDYDGTYCLPSGTTGVSVTSAGTSTGRDDPPGGSDTTAVIEEPERCFVLDEIFETDAVELQRIDGEWFGPIPS